LRFSLTFGWGDQPVNSECAWPLTALRDLGGAQSPRTAAQQAKPQEERIPGLRSYDARTLCSHCGPRPRRLGIPAHCNLRARSSIANAKRMG